MSMIEWEARKAVSEASQCHTKQHEMEVAEKEWDWMAVDGMGWDGMGWQWKKMGVVVR